LTAVIQDDAATSRGRGDGLLLSVSRKERTVIVAVLVAGTAAAWLYLAFGFHAAMGSRADMSAVHNSITTMQPWNAMEAVTRLLMWMVMMVAMMLPSAIPVALVYVAVAKKASRQATPVAPASALVAGYIGIWLLFSVAATAAQWALDRMDLLSSTMASNDALFGGLVVSAAGIYQLSALKAKCLAECRDPARLLAHRWRPGGLGAARMGAELGVYCLGCCWALTALLFVAGVMNLLWVAVIATFILLEKAAPTTRSWSRVTGVAMAVAGAASAAILG
jgi:predicted metal-binding membrane protein